MSNSILFGQSTKQIDYFKTLNLNLSDLQDYMIIIKFQFNGSKTDELGEEYGWSYNRNRYDNTKAECFYSRYINNDGTTSVSFKSTKIEDYQRFKSLIKQKDLLYINSKNINGSLVEIFSNSKYKSRIWSYIEEERTIYEMSLEKK